MDKLQLVLNENKGFDEVNQIQNLHVNLEGEQKLLPADDLRGSVDSYEQYLSEKDACKKYRLIFTIHPYCTNILHNHITEAVYHEGANDCKLYLKESDVSQQLITYAAFKQVSNTAYAITKDTGYSSPDIQSSIPGVSGINGYLNYNCGTDIFNNHLLRRKNFIVINPPSTVSEEFNTIFDVVRDPFQTEVTEDGTVGGTSLHIYNKDNLYSFKEALALRLKEENGWVGFTNTSILNTPMNTNDGGNFFIRKKTFGGTINRVVNNKPACTFIDMYPTREHYSFVPYFNEYRKRVEKNWEYVLTYPYKNEYDNFVVSESAREINSSVYNTKINGLICELDDIEIYTILENEPRTITFKTHTKHNLNQSDKIHMYIMFTQNGEKRYIPIDDVIVGNIGYNGYDSYHYFTINTNDILSELDIVNNEVNVSNIYFRFAKKSNNRNCKYYIRLFKELPNFKNTSISAENGVSENDIDKAISTNNFSSTLNKLAFSKTIYGDDVAQIIYNDDIDITGLSDNLGRELSVIYLTLIKTNKGHEKWYTTNNYGSSDIEFSHCFGKVTCGFDLPEYSSGDEYNVHLVHNIPSGASHYIQTSGKYLKEVKITDTVFYGDLVEFDENKVEEIVLERVQNRFNTAQRELNDSRFSSLWIDRIIRDDYDTGGTFVQRTSNLMCVGLHGAYKANLAPEGYYYQAHYQIKLREYSDTVNEGYHTIVNYTMDETAETSSNVFVIYTDKNYYFTSGDEIWLYKKSDNTKIIGIVTEISGKNFTDIMFNVDNVIEITEYKLFKPNRIKPSTAYEMNDGTGKYVWRDFVASSKLFRDSNLYDTIFTNGSIYIHKDINFYLKRQDPFGIYGLNPSSSGCNCTDDNFVSPCDLETIGNDKDVSYGDYFEPYENNNC